MSMKHMKLLAVLALLVVLISMPLLADTASEQSKEKGFEDFLTKLLGGSQPQPSKVPPTTTPPVQTPPVGNGLPEITNANGAPITYIGGEPKAGKVIEFKATLTEFPVVYKPTTDAKLATVELWVLSDAELKDFIANRGKAASVRDAYKSPLRDRQCFFQFADNQFSAKTPLGEGKKSNPSEITVSIPLKWDSACGSVDPKQKKQTLTGFYRNWLEQYAPKGMGLYLLVENKPTTDGTYNWEDTYPIRLNYSDECNSCNTILWCKACMDWKLVKSVFTAPAAASAAPAK